MERTLKPTFFIGWAALETRQNQVTHLVRKGSLIAECGARALALGEQWPLRRQQVPLVICATCAQSVSLGV
jgi:hypothetical protein